MRQSHRPSAGPVCPSRQATDQGGWGPTLPAGSDAHLVVGLLTCLVLLTGCDQTTEAYRTSKPPDQAPPASRNIDVTDETVTVGASHVTTTQALDAVGRASRLEPALDPGDDDHATDAAVRTLVPSTLDISARRAIVTALAEDGSVAASVALAATLSDPHPGIREEAVYALADIGDDSAVQILQRALFDPAPAVRTAAVAAFAEIGGDSSSQTLSYALQDEDPSIRVAVIHALGDIGGALAAHNLRLALSDSNAMVRQTAAQVIEELTDVAMASPKR